MSEHKRKVIREKVLALLKHNTSVGEEVYANRVKTLFPNHEPTILIYALQETALQTTMAPEKKYTRKISLAIEARVNSGSQGMVGDLTLDDYLDSLALQIEDIMKSNNRLLDSAANSVLQATRFDFSPAGDKLIGAMRLEYEITYFT